MTIESTVAIGHSGMATFVITTTGASSFEEASNAASTAAIQALSAYPGQGWSLEAKWHADTLTAISEVLLDPEPSDEVLGEIATAIEGDLESIGHEILPSFVSLASSFAASGVLTPGRLTNQSSLRASFSSGTSFVGDLSFLVTMSEADHATLRDLIHFLDDGPGTGAYRETLPSASPFPTSEVWWTSAEKTKKVCEVLITRDAAKKPTAEVWKVYDEGGSLIATVTDSILYSGPFETSRTRSFS